MPPALITLLPALIGLGTAGVSTGLELSGAFNPSTKPSTADTVATNTATQNNEKAAIGQQFPTLQTQVGGSVSPEYYSQMAQLATGTANSPTGGASAQFDLNQLFGGTGGPSAGLTQSTGSQANGLSASSPTPAAGTSNIVNDGISALMKQFNLGGS